MDKRPTYQVKKLSGFLFDCLLWNYRDLYLKLVISFLNYNTSSDEFAEKFISMRFNPIVEFDKLMKDLQSLRPLQSNFEFLKKFKVEMDAFEFADIIDLVEQNCDSFVLDELLLQIGSSREAREIDENQFRQRIEKAFPFIFQPQVDLDQIIQRSYIIFLLTSLGLLTSLIVPKMDYTRMDFILILGQSLRFSRRF